MRIEKIFSLIAILGNSDKIFVLGSLTAPSASLASDQDYNLFIFVNSRTRKIHFNDTSILQRCTCLHNNV